MELHIISEANRCLNCKNPLCQKGCPVQTPIPKAIQLFKENQIMEAGKLLFDNNPLSVICSTICNHEEQCAGHCILGKKETPVHFSSIENYISDTYLERMQVNKIQLKKKRVAVIGAGPAGMTVAIFLAEHGYPVTIFEWKGQIGGIMRYGIPEFRLQKSILDRYKNRMKELNIQIRPNTTIGAVLMIENLFRDGYSSVFIGTGAEKPKSLNIQGESLGNVHYGLNYLANPEAHELGKTVAVIGMGNAAMDVTRTAFRHGANEVYMFARNKQSSASSSEVAYAKLDGAKFIYGKQIQYLTEEGPVFKTAIFDESDNIVGYEEELDYVKADSTIISISQIPRQKLVRTTDGLDSDENGALIIDENYMTTRDGVFAAGDVVTGPKTVVHAVAGAKIAAEAMMRYMES